MSALATFAASTISDPPTTFKVRAFPFTVLADFSFIACFAITLPGTTW